MIASRAFVVTLPGDELRPGTWKRHSTDLALVTCAPLSARDGLAATYARVTII